MNRTRPTVLTAELLEGLRAGLGNARRTTRPAPTSGAPNGGDRRPHGSVGITSAGRGRQVVGMA